MIAKNHCLMQFRDKNRQAAELSEHLTGMEEVDETLAVKEKDQLLDWMHESIKNLNPEQQQCVTLFYLEKKSYQQIVEDTQFSLLQVKSNIQNGKRNLRLMIQRKLNEKENGK